MTDLEVPRHPTAFIGVDPGQTGALCFLDGNSLPVVVDMPTVGGRINPYALTAILIEWGPVEAAAVEQVHSMPRQGVSSSFTFGMGYGVLLGVLAALQRPVIDVTPSKWTKEFGVGSDKDLHRRRAMDIWPAAAQLFTRKKDDGRADAALIARWAQQQSLRAAV